MSILRSSDERAEATARLTAVPDDVLARDLVDWSCATQVSAERYEALTRELASVRELHAEEEIWIELHTAEIRRRRVAAAAARGAIA